MSGFGSGSTDWPPMTARAADKCDEFPSPHGFAHAKDHLGYERNITFWMKNFGWRIVPFVTPKPGRPDVRFGSKADIGHLRAMSALPPKADIGTQPPDVRFVPKADICSAAKAAYSITNVCFRGNSGHCSKVLPSEEIETRADEARRIAANIGKLPGLLR